MYYIKCTISFLEFPLELSASELSKARNVKVVIRALPHKYSSTTTTITLPPIHPPKTDSIEPLKKRVTRSKAKSSVDRVDKFKTPTDSERPTFITPVDSTPNRLRDSCQRRQRSNRTSSRIATLTSRTPRTSARPCTVTSDGSDSDASDSITISVNRTRTISSSDSDGVPISGSRTRRSLTQVFDSMNEEESTKKKRADREDVNAPRNGNKRLKFTSKVSSESSSEDDIPNNTEDKLNSTSEESENDDNDSKDNSDEKNSTQKTGKTKIMKSMTIESSDNTSEDDNEVKSHSISDETEKDRINSNVNSKKKMIKKKSMKGSRNRLKSVPIQSLKSSVDNSSDSSESLASITHSTSDKSEDTKEINKKKSIKTSRNRIKSVPLESSDESIFSHSISDKNESDFCSKKKIKLIKNRASRNRIKSMLKECSNSSHDSESISNSTSDESKNSINIKSNSKKDNKANKASLNRIKSMLKECSESSENSIPDCSRVALPTSSDESENEINNINKINSSETSNKASLNRIQHMLKFSSESSGDGIPAANEIKAFSTTDESECEDNPVENIKDTKIDSNKSNKASLDRIKSMLMFSSDSSSEDDQPEHKLPISSSDEESPSKIAESLKRSRKPKCNLLTSSSDDDEPTKSVIPHKRSKASFLSEIASDKDDDEDDDEEDKRDEEEAAVDKSKNLQSTSTRNRRAKVSCLKLLAEEGTSHNNHHRTLTSTTLSSL